MGSFKNTTKEMSIPTLFSTFGLLWRVDSLPWEDGLVAKECEEDCVSFRSLLLDLLNFLNGQVATMVMVSFYTLATSSMHTFYSLLEGLQRQEKNHSVKQSFLRVYFYKLPEFILNNALLEFAYLKN